jgi:signal transduction histidine kinase
MTPHERAPLQPVLLGLRIALHVMVVALVVFVGVRAILAPNDRSAWILALAIVLLVSYLGGAALLRGATGPVGPVAWLCVVSLGILGLAALTSDAAFLVFPLFFLQLHLLRGRVAVPVVAVTTGVVIAELALRDGLQVGAVAGPLIGAAVAIVIGLGYRALYREMREREQLLSDLERTRGELAEREHEAGVLAERGRLAREIHDTVAQGLSSIQLLLHAAEREGASGMVLERIRLARETAAADLAETRRFIRELSPPALDGGTLEDALDRLAAAASLDDLEVSFSASGDPADLPMNVEATLLRIAQASLSNVTRHAQARHAELTLTRLGDWVGLDIVDDGRGFDARAIGQDASFGLSALRARVRELGGALAIESAPGRGTAIAVSFDISAAA